MSRKPLTSNWWWIFPRVIMLHAIFLILHYLYEWLPTSTFVQVIAAVGESNFQHWKIATFSFIIVSLIEIPFSMGEVQYDWWWFGRIFSTIFVSFVIFIVFYTVFLFIDTPSFIVEIVIANIGLLGANLATSVLEWQFREKKVHIGIKIVLLVLLIILIAEFIVFTFKLPVYDIFTDPYTTP